MTNGRRAIHCQHPTYTGTWLCGRTKKADSDMYVHYLDEGHLLGTMRSYGGVRVTGCWGNWCLDCAKRADSIDKIPTTLKSRVWADESNVHFNCCPATKPGPDRIIATDGKVFVPGTVTESASGDPLVVVPVKDAPYGHGAEYGGLI